MIGRVGRALAAVGVALLLMIGGLGLAVYLSRDEDNLQVDNLLAENVTRAITLASESGGEVVLAQLARFEWASVLLVARGTSAEAISERIGEEWTGVLGFSGGELLIFLDGGEPVRFADYRGEGRFEGFDAPFHELPRADAVLDVHDLVIRPG
jgi:hypothetical protein